MEICSRIVRFRRPPEDNVDSSVLSCKNISSLGVTTFERIFNADPSVLTTDQIRGVASLNPSRQSEGFLSTLRNIGNQTHKWVRCVMAGMSLLQIAACAKPATGDNYTPPDQGDYGERDLGMKDGSRALPDLSSLPDLEMSSDLSEPEDAPTHDLISPDLTEDLTEEPDLSSHPDLTTPPDQMQPPDQAAPVIISFAPPSGGGVINLPAGVPQSIATGDFNRDGHRDLAWNDFAFNVQIAPGNGNGTFRPHYSVRTGTSVNGIAVGDINNDSSDDFATVVHQSPGTVYSHVNNGSGVFFQAGSIRVGDYPNSIVLTDLNNDGRLDGITSNTASGNVSVLMGNGNGTFRGPFNVGAGKTPSSVAPGDFNGDGMQDAAVTNAGDNTVTIFFGNGTGALRAGTNYAVPGGPWDATMTKTSTCMHTKPGSSEHIALVNVIGPQGQTGAILLNNGGGTFSGPNYFDTGGTQPRAVVAADLNGDKLTDLSVVNNASHTLGIVPGNGDGTFQTATVIPVCEGPYDLAVADFNEDGKPDIAVACVNDQSIHVLLNTSP